ncbi:MAG TPA: trypsin-like peptidase domain-containing protein [Bryobacteraceae bacterium]|nr:trypsin-like peptidase domain-containing protein [Bryobacteraceae bacterium]
MMLRATASLALLVTGIKLAYAQAAHETNALEQLSGSVRELTNRVSPAVVKIVVTGYATTDDASAHPVSLISRQRSSGSGVVVDKSGYIMTNAHVVQGAVKVQVLLAPSRSPGNPDPQQVRPAQTIDAHILGIDRESDLALLRVEAKALSFLRFGNSDNVRQGDVVLAIGSPMGLRNSVSMGVVSTPARAVSEETSILYIQTDASINPGNSGGALVDTSGALIGLNTFILTQSGGNEGIGFGIPSNVVRNVYRQLRQKGSVSRGTIGLVVQDINLPMAKGLALPVQSGVIVADVDRDGPAYLAGLKRQDVILTLNGKPVETARQFEAAIRQFPGGEKITIVVQRGESRLSMAPEVKEQSAPWDPLTSLVSPEKNLVPRLGILCIEIDKKVVEMLPDLRRQYGLIVAAKSPEGQAQFIDLQPGDIIHAMNGTHVAVLSSFRATIDAFQRGDAVVLQIERDGRFQYVAFEIE